MTSNLHAAYQFETARVIFVVEHISIVTFMAYLSRMIVHIAAIRPSFHSDNSFSFTIVKYVSTFLRSLNTAAAIIMIENILFIFIATYGVRDPNFLHQVLESNSTYSNLVSFHPTNIRLLYSIIPIRYSISYIEIRNPL